MKPNTSNLTQKDYDLIEEWLDEGSRGCPGIGCESRNRSLNLKQKVGGKNALL